AARGPLDRGGLRGGGPARNAAGGRGAGGDPAGAAGRRGLRRLPARLPRAPRQRPPAGGDLPAARDRGCARRPRGGGRCSRDGDGVGADRLRALSERGRGARGGRPAPLELSGRDGHGPTGTVRWIRGNWMWLRWPLLLAAIVLFFVLRHDLPHVNLDKLIQDLANGLGGWTYLLVGALAFLETGAFVGLIAPGEFTVMLGGAVAQQGGVSLPLILAVTWLCAFTGDSVSFMLGSRLGRGFLVRHGP